MLEAVLCDSSLHSLETLLFWNTVVRVAEDFQDMLFPGHTADGQLLYSFELTCGIVQRVTLIRAHTHVPICLHVCTCMHTYNGRGAHSVFEVFLLFCW